MFVVKVPKISIETQGCKNSGNAILKVLREMAVNENREFLDMGDLDLEEIHLDNSNEELSNKLIYENAFETFELKPFVVFLGGDHSASYSLTRAFLDFCQNSGKEPCLIIFDSHLNCKKSSNNPSHREWLRKLIEEGFPSKNILLIGVRSFDKEEVSFLEKNKIKIISVNSLENDLQNTCDLIMEFSSGKELYVSIDIDVIDPSFASSTPFPEPGGLTSRQFIYLIQRIKKIKKLKAMDLVGIDSDDDKTGLTIKLGAKILSELM